MKTIQNKDLYKLIHGALEIDQVEKGALCFHRFTENQYNRYEAKSREFNIDFLLRSRASSGITVEMITDSSMIGIKCHWMAACRAFAGFDCYVDNVLYDHIYTENPNFGIFCFELPEGIHQVRIDFPWSVIVILEQVVLDEDAMVEPVTKDMRILAFGDSITQGYITKHPSLSYVSSVTRKLNSETLNQAVGGYFFDKEILDDNLAGFKPDLITIAYGTNDYSWMPTEPELFSDKCIAFVTRLTELFPTVKILGILPIHRGDSENTARNRMSDFKLEDGRNIIRSIYESFPDITILDNHFYPKHSDFFAPDYLHPNDLGSAFYADAVISAIRKLI